MINESVIFSFLDSKYGDGLGVTPTFMSDGMLALVFTLSNKGADVMDMIYYIESKKTCYKVKRKVLLELESWFGINMGEGERIVSKWFEEKSSVLLNPKKDSDMVVGFY